MPSSPSSRRSRSRRRWQNLDSILEECDGVMVARGDLGVEMALEKVPGHPEEQSSKRRAKRGKFVITATQMLESMIEHPLPTRAEVSDVANAIHDGTSAVMLSAETSAGKYPMEAVQMMARIACETEESLAAKRIPGRMVERATEHPGNHRGCRLPLRAFGRSGGAGGRYQSGASARLLARYRPPVPIYAFQSMRMWLASSRLSTALKQSSRRPMISTDQMLHEMERMLVETGRVQPGDNIVFVAGQPVGLRGSTNMLKLHRMAGIRNLKRECTTLCLIVSFGGPEKTEDVMPFLENVTRGRNIPRERLLEVAEHYYHFGGKSPINDQIPRADAALRRNWTSTASRCRSIGAIATGIRSWRTRCGRCGMTASAARWPW